MSGFDLIIAGVFLISVLVGIMRGFIKEALSVTSWIVAIWLGSTFCHEAGDFFAQYVNIPNMTFRVWIGFTLVFVSTLFLFAFISFVVTKLLVRGPIKGTDRVLGIASGAARAGLIVAAVLMVARGVGMEESEWWKNSQYLQYFLPIADYIEPMIFDQLPESMQDQTPAEQALQKQVLDSALDQLSGNTEGQAESP
jgi:membrane protein required for colicin V production